MLLKDKEHLFAECDKNGHPWARAYVEAGNAGPDEVAVREWINIQDDLKRQELANQEALRRERERREDAVLLKDSIEAAKKSAFWTMVAAIVAALSVIIPLLLKLFCIE
ncbi:MAG: hypothetical protein ACAH12_03415 [Methylophilaceae bacterium]